MLVKVISTGFTQPVVCADPFFLWMTIDDKYKAEEINHPKYVFMGSEMENLPKNNYFILPNNHS